MTTAKIHLICGVPGAGKTWVATQLKQFEYLPHDNYPVPSYQTHLHGAALGSDKPVLGEAPFRIAALKEQLEQMGLKVVTYYITEPEHVIRQRYENRTGKPFPKQHTSNLSRYDGRAWDHRGTSQEILTILQEVEV